MANIPEGQLVEFPGFPYGIDNLSKETGVKANALREAMNIDLDDEGRPSRRQGYELVTAGNVHSLVEAFGFLFGVMDGELTAFDPDNGMAETVLATGFSDEQYLSYAELGERLWFTHPLRNGMITVNQDVVPIWPAAPAQPTVSANTTGGALAGDYQVVVTVRDEYGRESGGTMATLVTVAANGGVLLQGLPSLAGTGQNLRLYMTRANEDELYFIRDIPAGTTQLLVGASTYGKHLDEAQQWLQPMPPGQAIAYGAGRLWIARGDTLYYSLPMRYGAMPPDNYIKMTGDITLLAPVGDADNAGIYVAAGKRTLYLSGPDPKTMQMIVARPAGAVSGTYHRVHTSTFLSSLPELPATSAALWMSSDGVFCLGLPGGQIKPLTQARLRMTEDAERGAVLVREEDGLNQVVASVSGGTNPRAAASDELVGTIYRGGIVVD